MREGKGRASMAARKKQEIEFRYYEIPQNEPCMALLGEAWIRPYGEAIDCLHFHNYMEVGFCYDGHGVMELDEQTVPYRPDMFTVIPRNFPHNTNSDNFSLSRWEYLFIDVEAFLREMYGDDSLYTDNLSMVINNRAWAEDTSKYPELAALIKSIMDEMRYKKEFYVDSVRGLLLSLLINIARMNHGKVGEVRKQSRGCFSSVFCAALYRRTLCGRTDDRRSGADQQYVGDAFQEGVPENYEYDAFRVSESGAGADGL